MSLMAVRAALLLALVCAAVACGSGDSSDDVKGAPNLRAGVGEGAAETEAQAIARKLSEKPWEVISNKGETYLPDVFYADASQNEQVMPYALDGHVMIDRLVYPTLGNPNLYTKSDPTDELVVVTRLEEEAIAHLSPKFEPVEGSALSRLVVPNDAATGFGFFLVPRKARNLNTEAKTAISSGQGTDVIRVFPHEILVSPEPDGMPAVLKKRKTVRFVFKQGSMTKVPAGLYDLRFEVRDQNKLAVARSGAASLYEYQYNAVRVFDSEPEDYSVVNVTDTQVSVGDFYESKTLDHLDEFVNFVNTTNDPNVRGASFITFNGDLHNGGSPGSLLQRKVAWGYNDEAKAIVDVLKYLPLPIFLTTGNHDGYVSTGQVPAAVTTIDSLALTSLRDVINGASPKAWPDFEMSDFERYLARTKDAKQLGGTHRDVFTGAFSRTSKLDGFAGWKETPRADRNYILYDGFYQWQKTYGPLYYSHKFGKNTYVSMNSFELRQHRRAGWGMYTVNYGGGMSDVQATWIDRELLRAKTEGTDVVVLAHHDPRGGHRGKDLGYYFEQLEYRSIYQSAVNYLAGKIWNPVVCTLPDWALSQNQADSCVHDGLQEWMRSDPEFDCDWTERDSDFSCKEGVPQWASGIELTKRVSASNEVRTILLGHTHYNELEILQQGDELLPVQFPVDASASQRFASLEVQNPVRGFSALQELGLRSEYDTHALTIQPFESAFARFSSQYETAIGAWPRRLEGNAGPGRELVVMRLVSNADLSAQTTSTGKGALGFSVLSISKKTDVPRIQKAVFFANVGTAKFQTVGAVDIDRTAHLKARDANHPVAKLFKW